MYYFYVVAGILVQVGGHNSPCILLDCGENTYGQMCRFFGRETAKNIIQNHLIAIAISHSHADHHLGIAQILHLKSTATAEESRKFPIHLISSATVLNWVRHYAAAARVPHILAPESLKMVPIKEVCEEVRSDVETFFARYGIMLRSVLVEHCYDAHGYVVVGKGWKISYSGDSRPLESFAVAASNSTVLIHEATLSDNMKAEAIVKKHSTIEEAISIGKMYSKLTKFYSTNHLLIFLIYRSQSEHTVLTHFSQRFPKLSDSMLVEASNFIYGSDMLTFTRSQLPQLMKLAPAIAAVLKSNEEEAAAGGDEPKQETAAINENKAKGGKKHKKRTTENFKI